MNKFLIIVFFLLTSCGSGVDIAGIKKAKADIVETEKAFAKMAASKGLSEAFGFYADSAASLNRGSYVIHGKDSISLFYQLPRYNKVRLEWAPDFVDVSASADLGYTYGKYTFTSSDSLGNPVVSKGIFHTVWKKQADGSWRFVWD